MGRPIATVVGQSVTTSESFQLPETGNWKERSWRGIREERWEPERIICFALAEPEARRPGCGYGADNGRR